MSFCVVREHKTNDDSTVLVTTDHETCADAVMCLAEYIVYHRQYLGSSGMVVHV